MKNGINIKDSKRTPLSGAMNIFISSQIIVQQRSIKLIKQTIENRKVYLAKPVKYSVYLKY